MEPLKEKWKTMTFGQKAEYLWMYYKGWLAAAVCVICAVLLGIMMYRGAHTKVLLNIVITGGDSHKAEAFVENFCSYAGVEEKDGVVRLKANVPEDGGSVKTKTTLTTLMGAEAVDVLICSGEIYEEYHNQDGFLPVIKVLEDAGATPEQSEMPKDAVIITKTDKNPVHAAEMITYDTAYVTIPVNCQNPEMAAKFLEYMGM